MWPQELITKYLVANSLRSTWQAQRGTEQAAEQGRAGQHESNYGAPQCCGACDASEADHKVLGRKQLAQHLYNSHTHGRQGSITVQNKHYGRRLMRKYLVTKLCSTWQWQDCWGSTGKDNRLARVGSMAGKHAAVVQQTAQHMSGEQSQPQPTPHVGCHVYIPLYHASPHLGLPWLARCLCSQSQPHSAAHDQCHLHNTQQL
jgi:hypothetical protein